MWIRILPEGRLRKSIIYSPSSKLKLFPSIASWFYNFTQIIFGSNCLLLCPQPDETREAIWCFYASLLPVHTCFHLTCGLRTLPGTREAKECPRGSDQWSIKPSANTPTEQQEMLLRNTTGPVTFYSLYPLPASRLPELGILDSANLPCTLSTHSWSCSS